MEQGGLLQIHAEWAARIRANPMTECPIQMSEAGVVWLVCPTLAKDIFSLLEAEDQLPKPPVTHQVLLREALTSVNGSGANQESINHSL